MTGYRLFFITILFFAIVNITHSQNYTTEETNENPSKFYFGGNVGLQIGTITNIEISPLVGYKLSERFSPGIGLTYQYFSDTRYNFSTQIYGGNVFARYRILDMLFAHAEIEALNIQEFNLKNFEYTDNRIWIYSPIVGLGYFQKFTERAGATFMILWNLNETSDSPYTNPIFRVGFVF